MNGPYRPPIRKTWYLKRPRYVLFMIRELTSVALLAYMAFFIYFLCQVGGGQLSYEMLMEKLNCGWAIGFHCLAIVGAVWHAVTWFSLTPKAMPLRIGEELIPAPIVIFATGYGPWIAVSAVIFFLLAG